MSDDPGPSLEDRITRLERLFEQLENRLPRTQEPAAPPPPPPPSAPNPEPPTPSPQPPSAGAGRPGSEAPAASTTPRPSGPPESLGASESTRRWDQFGEQWLGRVGVGFVILALSFLFKLAFDRGWITPPLRLVFGLGVGTALLLVGHRLEESRRRYGQVLMGGAIGVFYLVGFAGYQWYGLLPYPVALSYMVAVTVLAMVLGVRQDQETLAAIGALGGLATPFLLYTEQGSISGLMVYLVLILAGAGTVQVWRGWLILQMTLLVAGFAVLLIASTQGVPADRWLVPLGTFVWWLMVGASPLLKRWSQLAPGREAEMAATTPGRAKEDGFDRILVRVLGVFCSLAAVAFTALALDLGEVSTGTLILGLGGLYATAAVRGPPVRGLAADVAAVLIPVGTYIVLSGPAAFLVLTVEAAIIHLLATRSAVATLHALGHALVGSLAVWLLIGALGRVDATLFDSWAVSTLGSIALVFATSFVFWDRFLRSSYQLGAYVALLYWLVVELSPLAHGPALVSISWGAIGVLTLVLGWRRGSREIQSTGLGTLAVTAAKLLLVDMVQLDMMWRILVFLGFGAVFLALSYLINRPPASTSRADP